MSGGPVALDTKRFAAIVDDPTWIVYADEGFVAFPADIQVGYAGGGHWLLTRPTSESRIIWAPSSELIWSDHGITIPCGVLAGALAQALDDGDSKRVWTMYELHRIVGAL